MSAQNKGFTLIELLVVVAIIALLSLIGLAIFSGAQGKARDAKRRSDVDAIVKVYEQKYQPLSAQYSPISNTDFTSGKIPTSPEGENYTGYNTVDTVSGFQICAKLGGFTGNCPATGADQDRCYCRSSSLGRLATTPPPTAPPPPGPVPPPPPGSTLSSPCGSNGDVTGDGQVTNLDADEVTRIVTGGFNSATTGQPFSDLERLRADVNGNGQISVTDSTIILQYIAGTRTTFPVCTSRAFDCENYGDADGNRVLSNDDVVMINKSSLRLITLTADQRIIADVNYDPNSNTNPGTTVDQADARNVSRYLEALDAHLPICNITRQVPVPPGNGIGDVSTDGKITFLDVTEIKRIIANIPNSIYTNQPYTTDPTTGQTTRADFSRDGSLASTDALCLRRFLNNQPATTACPLQ